jgi:hypothetical protein
MRAGESLSPFPLGERILMAAVGRLRNGDECGIDTGVSCHVEGENGVLHVFDDQDVPHIKEVEILVDEPAPGALSFLGIGTARSQADVIRNVEIFAPGLTFVCGDHSEYVEDEGSTLCEAQVGGHGSIAVVFTNADKLWLVRQKVLASG